MITQTYAEKEIEQMSNRELMAIQRVALFLQRGIGSSQNWCVKGTNIPLLPIVQRVIGKRVEAEGSSSAS